MSRRVHACISCPGRTRHRGPCAACRRRGVTLVGDELSVPIWFNTHLEPGRVRLITTTPGAQLAAPSLAQLERGVDLTPLLAWHGTDCACIQCSIDRIPGRYA